jgi:hypothetical protein
VSETLGLGLQLETPEDKVTPENYASAHASVEKAKTALLPYLAGASTNILGDPPRGAAHGSQ